MKLKLLSLVLIVIFTQDIKQLVAAAPSTFIPVAEPVAKAKAAAADKAKAAAKAKADKAKAAAAPAKADKAKAAAAPAKAAALRLHREAEAKATAAEALVDCKKWWDNYNRQLLMNPMRTMAVDCSKYIKDCYSYDDCKYNRSSDENDYDCECFFNQKWRNNRETFNMDF